MPPTEERLHDLRSCKVHGSRNRDSQFIMFTTVSFREGGDFCAFIRFPVLMFVQERISHISEIRQVMLPDLKEYSGKKIADFFTISQTVSGGLFPLRNGTAA